MKLSIFILLSILQLSCLNVKQDHKLIGTWYSIDQGELHSVSFRPDKTFEFHVKGLDINRDQLKSRNIEMKSSYEVLGDNQIHLRISLIHPDSTFTIDLKGIYELLDNSSLRLDFRPSNEPLLQKFTDKSVIYTNDLNDLESKFPVEDRDGNYIFTYEKDNVVIRDTIRPADPRFIRIDTLYQKIMNQKK